MVTRARAEALMDALFAQLEWRLADDLNNEIPTDAATLGIIKGLLKDNEVTIAATDDQLQGVRDGLKKAEAERNRIRAERKANALALVKEDQLTGT